MRILHENGRIAHAVKRLLEIFYARGLVELSNMLEIVLSDMQLAMLDEDYKKNNIFKERAARILKLVLTRVEGLDDHERFAWQGRLAAIDLLLAQISQSEK